MNRPTGLQTFHLLAGTALLAYGVWSLHEGSVISTWGTTVESPNLFYWITTITILALGAANLFLGIFGKK